MSDGYNPRNPRQQWLHRTCKGPKAWEGPNPFEITFSFLVVMVVVKLWCNEGFKDRLETTVLK